MSPGDANYRILLAGDDILETRNENGSSVASSRLAIRTKVKDSLDMGTPDKLSAGSIETFISTPESKMSQATHLCGLDAVKHAYLNDNKNHFLKCMVLTLAGEKSKREVK